MQLPALFRRGVVRPLDDHAERQLLQFSIEAPLRVEWLPILEDPFFDEIWGTGLFQRINQACGTNISDYEEEILPAPTLQTAIAAIRTGRPSGRLSDEFCQQLEALLTDAAVTNRSVFFVM
ncbi:hypothetical protein LOC68_23265 [Blastopirellula sp. JC732]|uniref:Uncharacterized protein n=1 Tax=Blastopirellula sediminis TaxID=2894196 RepID=A0A9X1MTJ6_9BACT|nr:hypothetical protein [Blastopirellula sediminis]MCC9605376.1 hypothetical protein [Blastopirellula sediminis]MCC9631324.1 hypothetical protein [Blastopirellula sediminis]